MSTLNLGILLWSQGADLAGDARRGQEGRPTRLRAPLDMGSPVRDLRRPVPADLRGLGAAPRVGPRDRADEARAARRRQHVPQSRARRQARQRRSITSATGERSSASAGHGWSPSTRPTESSSGRGSASAWTGSMSPSRQCARVLDGQEVTSQPGGHYAFDQLRHQPLPLQARLPIMIGGSGEKKTLRTVARYADMWNAMGPVDVMRHKIEVLRQHCEDVGRDPAEIEFTLGIKATIRDSAEEADRVWKAAMEHNRTPMSRGRGRRHVLERHTGAARREARAVLRDGLPHRDLRAAGAVRHRDARAPDRPGQAAGRSRIELTWRASSAARAAASWPWSTRRRRSMRSWPR